MEGIMRHTISIGDEVGTDTISGLVYKIDGEILYFEDEYGLKYRMNRSQVTKTNYIGNWDRAEIAFRHGIVKYEFQSLAMEAAQ